MAAYFVFRTRFLDAQKMQAYVPKATETMEGFSLLVDGFVWRGS